MIKVVIQLICFWFLGDFLALLVMDFCILRTWVSIKVCASVFHFKKFLCYFSYMHKLSVSIDFDEYRELLIFNFFFVNRELLMWFLLNCPICQSLVFFSLKILFLYSRIYGVHFYSYLKIKAYFCSYLYIALLIVSCRRCTT